MKLTPLQNNFSAGELSELVRSRSDLKAYNSGLDQMENMIPDSRGPAISRPGTSFIESYSGNYGRLMTFQVTDALFFIGVFTNLKFYVASPVGGVPAENQITNSRFLQLGDSWTVSTQGAPQSYVNFAPFATEIYGSRRPNDYAQFSQQVTITNTGVQHTVRVAGGAQDTIRIKIGTSINAGDIVSQTTNTYITTIDFMPNPSFLYYYVTIEHSGQDSTTDTPVIIASVEGYETNSGVVEFDTPWNEQALRDLHLIQAPAGETYYFTHPLYPTYKMIFDETSYTFTFTQVTFANPPTEWVVDNYPGTGVIYQGRLYLGSTPSQPETFWASKSGSYEDFDQGTQQDDEGFTSTINNYGRIRWLMGTKNLLVGTENGEYIVTAQNKTLTPSDRNIEQQSSYGSNTLQPKQVGDQVFYVSPDGTKLRSMEYEWTKDNWLSRDLTFASEHITNGGIIDFDWQQNPNNILWAVRADGTECSMTYERSENIYGWTRHLSAATPPDENINGVVAMTVPQYYGYSMLYTLTQRLPGYLYLELQAPYVRSTRIGPRIFMDSHTIREYPNGTTTVTGLEHLEGYTVQVLADGAVHPDKVVTGGEITLDYSANIIQVGLAFNKRVKTLPLDRDIQSGSLMSYSKHRNKIYVRIIDSARPIINGTRPPSRTPDTPMNTIQPPATEDISVANIGWDLYAPVEVVQDLPLPLTIAAIYGEIKVEHL